MVRAGVVGTGFGANTIVPALSQLAGVEVVAISGGADARKTRAIAEAYHIPRCAANAGEICAMSDVDLVAVASPHYCHFDHVRLALEHGKHVVCEKPLALTPADIDLLVDESRKSDRLHLVDHQLRFHPPIVDVRNRIRRGEIGRVYQVSMRYQSPRYLDPAVKRREWWFRDGLGGGMVAAMGPHLVDLVQYWLASPIAAVTATSERVLQYAQTEDAGTTEVDAESCFACHLRLADGAAVLMSVTALSFRPMSFEFDVYGSEGQIGFLSPDDLEVHTRGSTATSRGVRAGTRVSDAPGATLFQNAFRSFARALVRAIETGDRSQIADATDFADYAATHRVLGAIKQSCREGRTVALSL